MSLKQETEPDIQQILKDWLLVDLDGDGIEELVISVCNFEPPAICQTLGYSRYMVFKKVDGEVKIIFSGQTCGAGWATLGTFRIGTRNFLTVEDCLGGDGSPRALAVTMKDGKLTEVWLGSAFKDVDQDGILEGICWESNTSDRYEKFEWDEEKEAFIDPKGKTIGYPMNPVIIEIKEKIHPSLPEFLFKIYGYKDEKNTCHANKILILELGEKVELIQELLFDETATPDAESLGIVIEDMNFDGFKDIRIQQFLPANPNISYYCWLWDQKSSKFISNKDLEHIISPEFDHENETIYSSIRDGAAAFYELLYKYINDTPTLIWEKEYVADLEHIDLAHITIRELLDGEMKIVKEYDEKLK